MADVRKIRDDQVESFSKTFEKIALRRDRTLSSSPSRCGIFGRQSERLCRKYLLAKDFRLREFRGQAKSDHATAGPDVRLLDNLKSEISKFEIHSTISSVSGRGTSARLSQRKVCPQNSTVPSKCCNGSPWPRRLTNSRNGASSVSARDAFELEIKLDAFLPENVREQMLGVQSRALNLVLLEIGGRRLQHLENGHWARLRSTSRRRLSRRWRGILRLQPLRQIGRLQGCDHFLEVAFHDAVEIIER